MHCIRPLKASLDASGSITFSQKNAIPGLVPFEIMCRKCLPCRLNQAREKAVRCWHESRMYPDSIFVTLTYDEEHLESPWLEYQHFQKFMMDLRNHLYYENPKHKIHCMVTGEYGDKHKRPHWHAIIFNYTPPDKKHDRITERGDEVFTSETLTKIWQKGMVEFGSVTLDSANYVARYAAKKLAHGSDDEHLYHPIHHTPKKRALGKSWIETYWKQTFENGFIILPNGQQSKIPRYYVDWAKKNRPEAYLHYVTNVLPNIQKKAETTARKEEVEYISEMLSHEPRLRGAVKKRSQVKETILQQKFKKLQERLKL